jgi:hypothetical protein
MYVGLNFGYAIVLFTHADQAAYVFPNDAMECDRLDLQYEALKALHDNRIFFAPLKDPRRILDIGTGTGIWPIEMGELCYSGLVLEQNRIRRLTLWKPRFSRMLELQEPTYPQSSLHWFPQR